MVKTHKAYSFIFSLMSRSFSSHFFQSVASISVLFAPVCRTYLKPFLLVVYYV